MKLWMGLVVVLVLTQGVNASYLAFRTDYPASYDISGFDWLSRIEVFRIFDGKGKSHSFEANSRRYTVRWEAEPCRLTVLEDGVSVAEFDLIPLLSQLKQKGKPPVQPQAALTLEVPAGRQKKGRARLNLEDLAGEWTEGKPILHHFKGDLLFTSRKR